MQKYEICKLFKNLIPMSIRNRNAIVMEDERVLET